jgi:hypothetical protein
MQRLLIAAAALSFMAGPALAQDTGSAAVIGGTVGGKCGTTGSSSVDLGPLTDGQGFLSVADRAIDFGEMWCNAPADLTMEVEALQGDGPVSDASSFVNRLDMTVSGGVMDTYFGGDLRTGPGGAAGQAGASTGFAFSTGASAPATLSVDLPAGTIGNDRPVAGAYTGSIIFTASVS